jgi:hypothetical protein
MRRAKRTTIVQNRKRPKTYRYLTTISHLRGKDWYQKMGRQRSRTWGPVLARSSQICEYSQIADWPVVIDYNYNIVLLITIVEYKL